MRSPEAESAAERPALDSGREKGQKEKKGDEGLAQAARANISGGQANNERKISE